MRFPLNSAVAKCAATQVVPLIRYIVVVNMNETADFVPQGVLNCHGSAAAITLLWHVLWDAVVPQARVVVPFLP